MSGAKPRILTYELPGGWMVFAGASDADNDYLSTQLAEPNDWWFHADKVPGSHVILRGRADAEPSQEILKQAAAVAAYHSKARHASTVSVHCSRARHVSKPRGVKTGTVNVSHGRVLKVRPDISFATRQRGGA
ncbi:MAG TPA: NFACT RNA binding domain-containing protein [Phototrophicaceae bacterium]|nr:NFACT RNA binding domain-containing protein [Phototrophicaceae bacterium]